MRSQLIREGKAGSGFDKLQQLQKRLIKFSTKNLKMPPKRKDSAEIKRQMILADIGPKFDGGRDIPVISAAFENDIGAVINILKSDKS